MGFLHEPEFMADAALRERAQAPVEEAIRGHFHGMGTVVDDATLRRDASIVLRGLTHSALARIASGGMSSAELIQALIPNRPARRSARLQLVFDHAGRDRAFARGGALKRSSPSPGHGLAQRRRRGRA